MSSIVVTLDLSDASKRALPPAMRIADAMGLPLVLLHVVHTPALAPALAGSTSLDRSDAEQELEGLARGLGERVRARVVEAEDVVRGIVEEATAAGAELLVVASRGRSGLERLHLGSVAEGLLEASRMPVVVVPAHGEGHGGTGRLIVASDLSDRATRAFPIAAKLADALALPITLLVVEDPVTTHDPATLDAQAARLREGRTTEVSTQVVAAPEPATGIVQHAKLQDAALVCTAAAPTSALRRLFVGSVSRDVVRASSFPVVFVPATDG